MLPNVCLFVLLSAWICVSLIVCICVSLIIKVKKFTFEYLEAGR